MDMNLSLWKKKWKKNSNEKVLPRDFLLLLDLNDAQWPSKDSIGRFTRYENSLWFIFIATFWHEYLVIFQLRKRVRTKNKNRKNYRKIVNSILYDKIRKKKFVVFKTNETIGTNLLISRVMGIVDRVDPPSPS